MPTTKESKASALSPIFVEAVLGEDGLAAFVVSRNRLDRRVHRRGCVHQAKALPFGGHHAVGLLGESRNIRACRFCRPDLSEAAELLRSSRLAVEVSGAAGGRIDGVVVEGTHTAHLVTCTVPVGPLRPAFHGSDTFGVLDPALLDGVVFDGPTGCQVCRPWEGRSA